MMEIEPVKFRKLLERATIGGSGIEPCHLNFTGDGVEQGQFNKSTTISSIMEVDKSYFSDYDAFGEIKFDVGRILKHLKSRFSGDKTIDIDIDDGKLYLDGKKTRFVDNLVEKETTSEEFSLTERAIPRDFNVIASHQIIIEDLRDMPWDVGTDTVEISFGDDLDIQLTWDESEEEVGSENTIDVKDSEVDKAGETIIDTNLLRPVLNQFVDRTWIHLNDEGQLLLSSEADDFKYCYVIAHREE